MVTRIAVSVFIASRTKAYHRRENADEDVRFFDQLEKRRRY
jgi:hypothetical protein